jgi:hypothetical protein
VFPVGTVLDVLIEVVLVGVVPDEAAADVEVVVDAIVVVVGATVVVVGATVVHGNVVGAPTVGQVVVVIGATVVVVVVVGAVGMVTVSTVVVEDPPPSTAMIGSTGAAVGTDVVIPEGVTESLG